MAECVSRLKHYDPSLVREEKMASDGNSSSADESEVCLRVSGLVGEESSESLSSGLIALDGVRAVEVHIRSGHVCVRHQTSVAVDVIQQRIGDLGFAPVTAIPVSVCRARSDVAVDDAHLIQSSTPEQPTQQEVTLSVIGMTCSSCTSSVEAALHEIRGVSHVEVQLQPGQARVLFDAKLTSVSELIEAVQDRGFEVPRSETKMEGDNDSSSEERQITIPISGMTCSSCTSSVTEALQGLPGVLLVNVELVPGQASIVYNPASVQPADLCQAIENRGFEASLHGGKLPGCWFRKEVYKFRLCGYFFLESFTRYSTLSSKTHDCRPKGIAKNNLQR